MESRENSRDITSERLTFTVREVAQRLGVSSKLVYQQIERGDIKALTFGRRRLIPKAELNRLVAPLESASNTSDPELALLLRLVADRMES